jgi:hypothetical protein
MKSLRSTGTSTARRTATRSLDLGDHRDAVAAQDRKRVETRLPTFDCRLELIQGDALLSFGEVDEHTLQDVVEHCHVTVPSFPRITRAIGDARW